MKPSRMGLAAALALASFHHLPALAQPSALPETTVTATRFREDPRSLPYGVSVVTAEDIARSGATTVNEALMRVLGIPGRQDLYGGGEYNLDLRGFGITADSNQVIVLDGVRLSEADQGGTRLSSIPIESIERIEVLRGSGAVLYGEGATGGVIVITTKAYAGRPAASGGSVRAAAGSFGLRDLRASGTLSAPHGFSFDAAVQSRRSDGWRANAASDLDASSVGAQWGNGSFRGGVRFGQDRLDAQLPGALTTAQYAANPRQAGNTTGVASIDHTRATLFAQADIGEWQLGAEAGRRDKELRSLTGAFRFDYDIAATHLALHARREWAIGSLRHALMAGADLGEWQRDTAGFAGGIAQQRSRGWYVRDELALAGGTRLSAGVRTERIDKTNTGAVAGLTDRVNAWELGASHPLTQEVTVFGRVGRSFRLANADEFSFTTPGVPLRPQTSRDVELGARWVRQGTRLEARLFRHALSNEIGYDPAAVGPFSAFGFPGANVNLDPTRRQGLEVEAAHDLTRSVTMRANAAVRSATFRAGPYAGNDVPLSPRRLLALRADWRPAEGHRLTGGVQWVGRQVPDFANGCRMPGYSTVDARYAYDWRDVELSLGVSNLLDRRFFTQAFACAAGAATNLYPEPGRAFTAAVRVRF